MDREHTVIYINRYAADVAGRDPEDCVGRKFWEVLYDSPGCRSNTCAAGEAVRTGRVATGEAHFKVRGREWPVRVICSPRYEPGGRTVEGCFQVMYEAKEEIHVSNEILRLVEAGRAGEMQTRGNTEEFKGNFRTLVEGLNSLLDAFVKPVAEASAVLSCIAANDLTARVSGDYQGDHAKLKDDINRMAGGLHDRFRSFAETATSLASSSEELSAVSQQMASNAEETATQANVVATSSDQVSRNVSSVASGTEQMQVSIREISKNSNEAARVARSAVGFAKDTNAKVAKLGESSVEIGKVIKVVTSIAQQTNLLALNATIEAARAGESGKGFAVVANEVKELAKKTAQATEEISRKIEAIQADTRSAMTAIEEIGAVITQIDDISNSIASAVEEQTATTNEIGLSVNSAAKGTEDIAANISGVAIAAQSTTKGAGDSYTASRELSRMASQLQAMLAAYKF
ncbi:MAG: PAS domain-containing protein [Bryobacterales bacterium]|nr:PAS domain-containing protein [Bryobacterales bacterium]